MEKISWTDRVVNEEVLLRAVAYPGILFRGVRQIQLRAEDSENGDLGAAAP